MQLSSLYMANIVNQVFSSQENNNKQQELSYQKKMKEYTQTLNNKFVKVSFEKTVQERAYAKEVKVLNSKIHYISKEG